jgi:beta-phosphoglucomutase-like phosphatase (HAD superfamily)
VLEHVVGTGRAARFAQVLAGDVVRAKKPAPDIYLLAVERLGVDPAQALVVEDSRNGMLAALGAGLTCLITVSSYTEHEDFTGAALVVSSLGDPGGARTEILADRGVGLDEPWVGLGDLRACLAHSNVS